MAKEEPTARWRLEISDAGQTRHYEMDTLEAAYGGWRALRDWGRDDVTCTLQRKLAGHWVDVADPKPLTGLRLSETDKAQKPTSDWPGGAA